MAVVIVTGMHRSGTSVHANIVQSHGIYMGGILKEGDRNNPYGYYEDPAFYTFHQKILERDCGHNWMVTQRTSFTQFDRQEAKRLIIQRNSCKHWGWKDPRTTIFLEEWFELLGPHALFLLVWRRCAEVVASCMRRSRLELNPFNAMQRGQGNLRARLFQFKKAYLRKKKFTETWLFHNWMLLSFIRQHPDTRHVLLSVDDVLQRPEIVTIQLNRLSGQNFSPSSVFIVDSKEMTKHVPDSVVGLRYRWQVKQMEAQLLEASKWQVA